MQRAAERADAGRAHQEAQPARAAVQNCVGEDRHQHRVGHAREADEPDQQEERADRRRARRRSGSRQRVAERVPCRLRASPRRQLHHQQARDDGQVGDAVQEEAPALADGRHQQTGQRRDRRRARR